MDPNLFSFIVWSWSAWRNDVAVSGSRHRWVRDSRHVHERPLRQHGGLLPLWVYGWDGSGPGWTGLCWWVNVMLCFRSYWNRHPHSVSPRFSLAFSEGSLRLHRVLFFMLRFPLNTCTGVHVPLLPNCDWTKSFFQVTESSEWAYC